MRNFKLVEGGVDMFRIRFDFIDLREGNQLVSKMKVVKAECAMGRFIVEELLAHQR